MEFNVASNALRSLLTLPAGAVASLCSDGLTAPLLELAAQIQGSRRHLRALPASSAGARGPAAEADVAEARDSLLALAAASLNSLWEARRLLPADPSLWQEYDRLVVWLARRLMEGPEADPRMDVMDQGDPPSPRRIVVPLRRRFLRLRRRPGVPYVRMGRGTVIA